ncbi:hypothetical protein [Granulicella tundricola]|uniref:Uncharacterized protein n=1 Tax=Granulicella tundricola (strain ATCC BAA-1859 / DSM 23138 / MP5ACTX9) TaxID=1198114 RepID=E8WX20_GRATM|nr:hypothetical protein [Granulicella tundricola]ADW68581.1 hypothetical protein AciX9_1528 [Granulicella tundricola MP5ACTX9]
MNNAHPSAKQDNLGTPRTKAELLFLMGSMQDLVCHLLMRNQQLRMALQKREFEICTIDDSAA